MNRLQKKCVIGTVGIHLLLLLILIVGPAFFNQEPKLDNTQILDMIPANLVDAAVNSGVQNAQPPAPTPVAIPKPPQPLQAIPLPPKIVTPPQPTPPPTPTPAPTPSLLDRVEKMFTPTKPAPTVTPDLTPAEHQSKPQQNNINVNTQMVKRTKQKNTTQHDNSQAFNNAARSLSQSLSSSTKVDMPGNASASYANYASVVKSIYDRALLSRVPSEVANKGEKARVKIVIGSDGTVISSEIISPSNDPAWDDAVQRTLDSVTYVAPFPDGATEKERTYNLGFSPEVAQSLQ